ncbi:glycoside hydrolase family 43 protein [Dysgonomonas sp. 25]|uniref:glycoside hydrolase family 43 protein n=1 Tax=Dysgonomonas sp. 25 TaxID=2302933 RepID=UPI0013D6F16E|nr:glycoside hydrolase family 43 protein [Dysgonomonas sp. 25]NDV68075.1 arabinan endo-1,5-alpha-L-arabinosidase [Dysgonomonas sp. 25]
MTRKLLLLSTVALALFASCDSTPKEVKKSGNPVFEGWYADPEGIIFDDEYWIYPTFSDVYVREKPDSVVPYPVKENNTINPAYNIQTFIDAFSSKDLVNWTKHPKVLSVENVPWVEYAMWAPSIIAANGKYYLFFGGNDIQNDNEHGGIGVAVADKPSGPFKDAIGKPLINKIVNGAQPIDQFVFKDKDGTFYMYYGGWGHCNVCKLSADLTSVVPFDDGEMFKEVTPENYVEGPFMFIRDGKYYFMWSEGGWGGPDYSVAYAIADSPMGPFKRIGKILQQDPEVAVGAGHHSVIHEPKSDKYYIVYHRRPLTDTHFNHRETCIDEMHFDENGNILPVKITFEGVEENKLQ